MTSIIAYILFALFLLLAVIHIYWSAGGQAGISAALPVDDDQKKAARPGPLLTFIVGIVFAAFGVFVLVRAVRLQAPVSGLPEKYGLWFIALLFIARAAGDFKYVGFFKKIRHTRFGRYDTAYYTPLSLFIGILLVILQWRLAAL